MRTTDGIGGAPQPSLDEAWAALVGQSDRGHALHPDAYRVAFADPEFLLRPETRGIRFQLELLKPELGLASAGIEQTVVVYGSARTLAPEVATERLEAAQVRGDAEAIARAQQALRASAYYAKARAFARTVADYSRQQPAEKRLFICTGGGPGIMEAANRGAHDAGMPSVGLNIVLPHEQRANPYVTPDLAFKFHYFALRKMHFLMRAQAVVAFPGGLGTLDELLEVLTLVQTHKMKPTPIVLFGSSYWRRILNFGALAEEHMIAPEDLKLFSVVDDVDHAWQVIRDFYQL
jgi:uncharacterized protein (TIGR00730 family)